VSPNIFGCVMSGVCVPLASVVALMSSDGPVEVPPSHAAPVQGHLPVDVSQGSCTTAAQPDKKIATNTAARFMARILLAAE
jgi:hypothetical protein